MFNWVVIGLVLVALNIFLYNRVQETQKKPADTSSFTMEVPDLGLYRCKKVD